MKWLALLAVLSQGDYDGKFVDHPSREGISQRLWNGSRYSAEELPKWIAKREPRVDVDLVDLEEPLAHHIWPGAIGGKVEIARADKTWKLSIELPIDSFLGDPYLAGTCLTRQIFGAASTARAMERGADLTTLSGWGLENPLIEAMAAHWAGSLDQEIEFVLRRHLSSDEELASLVKPIVAPEDGGIAPERGGPDDLTYHVLVKMLAPKENDKKLGTLYSALEKGQTFEGALKKASRKTLERLNADLPKFFESYRKERLPEKVLKRYRRVLEACEAENWDEVLEAVDAMKSKDFDFVLPETIFLLARASEELELEIGSTSGFYLDVADYYDRTDLGLEALRRCAALFRQHGEAEAAGKVLEHVRESYGWLATVREEQGK